MSCWFPRSPWCVTVKRPPCSSRLAPKAQRRAVRVGMSDGTDVEILSGVKAGERVIVDGQAGLPDDAAITVSEAQ